MSTPVAAITQVAKTEFSAIVSDVEVVAWSQQRARLVRIRLVGGSFLDIRITNAGDYSYHWEHRMTDGGIHRWDNAPHHHQIATYPHHLHNGNEAIVTDSLLPTTTVIDDVRYVLMYIADLISPHA